MLILKIENNVRKKLQKNVISVAKIIILTKQINKDVIVSCVQYQKIKNNFTIKFIFLI
jgi:hypothetical protein